MTADGLAAEHGRVESGLGHLIADDREVAQIGLSERSGNGHIGGVAAYGHQHAAYTGRGVARVKGPPAVFEIDLEPCAEIHWSGDWPGDVAKVAGSVARGDIQSAAESNGEVLEVAAYADALGVDIER